MIKDKLGRCLGSGLAAVVLALSLPSFATQANYSTSSDACRAVTPKVISRTLDLSETPSMWDGIKQATIARALPGCDNNVHSVEYWRCLGNFLDANPSSDVPDAARQCSKYDRNSRKPHREQRAPSEANNDDQPPNVASRHPERGGTISSGRLKQNRRG